MAIYRLGKLYEGPPMKKKRLETQLYKLFHGDASRGDDSIIGAVDELTNGAAVFVSLFDFNQDSPPPKRVIRQVFLCDDSVNITVAPKNADITKRMLSVCKITKGNDKPLLITGRTLHSQAQDGLLHCKKAFAFAREIMDANGNLPSGTNEDDLYVHVLDRMWADQNKKDTVDLDDEEEDDANGNADDDDNDDDNDGSVTADTPRPPGWHFKGWFAFVLFGPTAAKEYQSVIFAEAGTRRGSKNQGRADQRTNSAKEAAAKRATDAKAADALFHKHGLAFEQRVSVAMIAQQHSRSSDLNKQSALLQLGEEVSFLQASVNMKLQAAQALNTPVAWGIYSDAQKELDGRVVEYGKLRGTKRQRVESDFVTSFLNEVAVMPARLSTTTVTDASATDSAPDVASSPTNLTSTAEDVSVEAV